MNMILFYSVGGTGGDLRTGQLRRLHQLGGFRGLLDDISRQCEDMDTDRVHIHNPFGVYANAAMDWPGHETWMDQWGLLQRYWPSHANPDDVAYLHNSLIRRGIKPQYYVGNELTTGERHHDPQRVDECLGPLGTLQVDLILDATMKYRRGDDQDLLIQHLRQRGQRIGVEPWTTKDILPGPLDMVCTADRFAWPMSQGRNPAPAYEWADRPACEEHIILQYTGTADQLRTLATHYGATLAIRPETPVGKALIEGTGD